MKEWIIRAQGYLDESLSGIPQELNEIDWKLQLSDNNKKLGNHISAFANHPGGGFLAFGIDDKYGEVIGITEKAEMDKIIERLTAISRSSLTPEPKLDHSVIVKDGKPVLIIHVKESSIKPVYLKSGTIEDTYIRTGGTTRHATRQEVGALLLNSKALRYEELHASKVLSADEVLGKLDYVSIMALLNRPVPTHKEEIIDWFQKEKMIDRVDGAGYYITNFGALSCAKEISQFDDIQRKAIRVIKYKGLNKLVTEDEYVGKKGYAIGFSGLINFLITKLPHSEVIKNALRAKTSIYPDIALRELVANAIVHQDFTIRGNSVLIEIFDNRIEIANPGRLLPSKKIDRLIGTNPESRNEILASAMRRFNICEERGSGFTKSISAIELFGLPPLKFEDGENYFKVIMYSPKTFAQMSQEERIEACYQHTVLKYFSSSALTNASLRERLKVHEKNSSMISRVIKEAVSMGKIKPKDEKNKSRKFPEYVPYWA